MLHYGFKALYKKVLYEKKVKSDGPPLWNKEIFVENLSRNRNGISWIHICPNL